MALAQPQPRHRTLTIRPEILHDMLSLPDDVVVRSIKVADFGQGLTLLLESDNFDPVPEYAYPPMASATFRIVRDSVGGEKFVRLVDIDL